MVLQVLFFLILYFIGFIISFSGPIRYRATEDAAQLFTQDVMAAIAPGLYRLLPNGVADTLTIPLLWAATTTEYMSKQTFYLLPAAMKTRVITVVRND